MNRVPRSRSVATFACTAGCAHIWLSIAGATSSGASVAIAVSVTKSSARPVARRESVAAVAGAISITSARRASSTCASPSGPLGSNMSVYGLRWVIALNASGVTNSIAPLVSTTSTVAPACTRRLVTSTAL